MELKEFSHKGEAIEKEIKKEFQFMGRTIKKRRVGLIIAAAGVIAVIAVALFIHSQQFDVWDYITISYEGANGYAKPVFTLNKDKLYKELMGKSTDSDKSYNVKMLIASIETSTDEEDIANGDTYKVRLEVDKKYEDAAGAVYNAVVMEQVAKMAYISYGINPQLTMNKYLITKHFERKHGPNAYYGQK